MLEGSVQWARVPVDDVARGLHEALGRPFEGRGGPVATGDPLQQKQPGTLGHRGCGESGFRKYAFGGIFDQGGSISRPSICKNEIKGGDLSARASLKSE